MAQNGIIGGSVILSSNVAPPVTSRVHCPGGSTIVTFCSLDSELQCLHMGFEVRSLGAGLLPGPPQGMTSPLWGPGLHSATQDPLLRARVGEGPCPLQGSGLPTSALSTAPADDGDHPLPRRGRGPA